MATLAHASSGMPSALFDVRAIEAGVPVEAIAAFVAESELPMKLIFDVVVPARTLKHRKARAEHLSVDESDKFARLVRTYEHAVRVFGEATKARHWLGQPKRRFEGRTPLEMVRTEAGGRLVEEMLAQIDFGLFA